MKKKVCLPLCRLQGGKLFCAIHDLQVTMSLGWHREIPAKGHRYSLEGMSFWGYQKVHVVWPSTWRAICYMQGSACSVLMGSCTGSPTIAGEPEQEVR